MFNKRAGVVVVGMELRDTGMDRSFWVDDLPAARWDLAHRLGSGGRRVSVIAPAQPLGRVPNYLSYLVYPISWCFVVR